MIKEERKNVRVAMEQGKESQDNKKKRTNWGFPAESAKHNVSESQAECWTSDVSSLPLQLGS